MPLRYAVRADKEAASAAAEINKTACSPVPTASATDRAGRTRKQRIQRAGVLVRRMAPHLRDYCAFRGETRRFRDLYAGRASVEREFGRLKHEYGVALFVSGGLSVSLSMLIL